MAWTNQQQQVINSRNHNLLVSAAAGSGKTAVMVERIIERISDPDHPANIDRFLVVTFTNAAASEMKERIMKALDAKVEKDPQNAHLLKQLACITRAQITTIHSFCLNLIREHFMEIDLDPGFRVADETEVALLLEECAGEVLEAAYADPDEAFEAFLACYVTGRDDHGLEEMLKDGYDFVRSGTDPKGWLATAAEQFQVAREDLNDKQWMRFYVKMLRQDFQELLDLYDDLYERIQPDHIPAGYKKTITAEYESLEILREGTDLSSMIQFKNRWKKGRLAGGKKSIPECDEIRERRDIATKLLDQLLTRVPDDIDDIVEEMQACYLPMKGYCNLIASLIDVMAERKRERNLVDFADFEHFALSILSDGVDEEGNLIPSAIAMEKKAFFDEIYVDEYQDTNEIQEAIILLLCGESVGKHNLFTVGDVKQSIYRFRQAKPDLFLDRYQRYDEGLAGSELIELQNNFRSRKEVLAATNLVFYKIMKEALGGIEYTERVSLIPGRTFEEQEGVDYRTELLLLDIDDEIEVKSIEAEADMIGYRIKEMVEAGEYEYRDMVILLRATSEKAEKMQERLEKMGIPAYCESKKGSFLATEVQIVMNTLKVLDNERNDIPFASFLRAPFVGLSAEDMVYMTSLLSVEAGQVCPLSEHFHYYLKEGKNEALLGKLHKAAAFLQEFRAKKTYLSLYDLIFEMIMKTDYFHYAGAMPGGKRRQANLLMLMEKAKTFENGSFKGLFQFVRYMQQLQEYKIEYGEANVLGEKENVVRIMTIHKSKGLEYPVVFVSNLEKGFNDRDTSKPILLHTDYTLGPNVIWPATREKKKTLIRMAIEEKIREENRGEELRVLYVAMTRAKEKLILTATPRDVEKMIFNQLKRRKVAPTAYEIKKAKCYLDWIMMALRDDDMMGPVYESFHPGSGWDNVDSPFVAKIWNTYMLSMLEAEEYMKMAKRRAIIARDLHEQVDEEKKAAIAEEFQWSYDFGEEALKRMKYSVSEIKHKYMELMEQSDEVDTDTDESPKQQKADKPAKPGSKTFDPMVPKFLQKEVAVSPTTRGSAVHKCMELLDFSKEYTEASLDEAIRTFIAQGKVDDCYDVIPQDEILWFLHSDLGRRSGIAKAADQEFKERQFVMGLPLHRLEESCDSGELVVVQGIIDLYFVEDGEIVLVDYKTDQVKQEDGEQELLNRYKAQLDSYKQALEQTTGMKVKEIYISSFALRKNIEVIIDE